LDIVGLGFRMKRESRRALRMLVERKGSIPGLRLVREPDNPADPNAIKVCLPSRVMHGAHIGYLHRETAELLAPRIDAGVLVIKTATLESVDGELDKSATAVVRFIDKRKP
jgi:hypothetical protein